MKKIFFLAIISILSIQCKCYKLAYIEGGGIALNETKNKILEQYDAIENKYSLLYLRTDFAERRVKVYNEDSIFLDSILKSDPVLSIASILRVPRNKDIFIDDGKCKLRLSSKKLLSYKYIYISRNQTFDKKYTITLSNTMYGLR